MTQNIAIVGGGIIGLTIAEELSSQPGVSVTLLDRDIVGQGASARSAGLHFPIGQTTRVRQMTAESQKFYQAEIAANPTGPIRNLAMRVHMKTDADHGKLDSFLPQAQLQALGHPGPRVTSEDMSTWFVSGGHWCDVRARVVALTGRLQDRIHLREGCEVCSVSENATGVQITLSDGMTNTFDKVLLAPGPWALEPAFKSLTQPLDVRIKRIVAFHIDMPAHLDDAAEVFLSEDAFLLPVPQANHWLFSYTCEDWDVDPDNLGFGIKPAYRDAAADVLARYVPQWVDKLRAGRVFCDAYSPDRAPIIQPVTASGRIIFAGAANGAGYRLAPAMATRCADLVTNTLMETA